MKFQYRHNNDMFRRRVYELRHHTTSKVLLTRYLKPE